MIVHARGDVQVPTMLNATALTEQISNHFNDVVQKLHFLSAPDRRRQTVAPIAREWTGCVKPGTNYSKCSCWDQVGYAINGFTRPCPVGLRSMASRAALHDFGLYSQNASQQLDVVRRRFGTLTLIGDSLARQVHSAARCTWLTDPSIRMSVDYAPNWILPPINTHQKGDLYTFSSTGKYALKKNDGTAARALRDAWAHRLPSAGLIVLCWGLHYTSDGRGSDRHLRQDTFNFHLSILLPLLNNFASNRSCATCAVAILTPGTQHFPITGAFEAALYPSIYHTMNVSGRVAARLSQENQKTAAQQAGGCSPLSPMTPTLPRGAPSSDSAARFSDDNANVWRVENTLRNHRLLAPRVVIVPMHVVTPLWWTAHIGYYVVPARHAHGPRSKPRKGLDCTHHCLSPYLLQPLWWAFCTMSARWASGGDASSAKGDGTLQESVCG